MYAGVAHVELLGLWKEEDPIRCDDNVSEEHTETHLPAYWIP